LVVPEPYNVYCSDETRPQLEQAEWVIKGTDGKFYQVPSAPGGWMQRAEFRGDFGTLGTPLAQGEARSVCWTVYGDVGPVTMEGADLELR
jgi:hypothetical protein